MKWAKLHTDILGDPKLMRGARERWKGLVFLPWFIAFAKQADDDGRLSVNGTPVLPEDLVPLIPDATKKSIAEALTSLEAIGVLVRDDDKVLRFSRWERRQTGPSGPGDKAEGNRRRQQNHRDRQRALKHNTERNGVTSGVTALRNAPEERRGEEKRKEESTVVHDRGKATAEHPEDPRFRLWLERLRTQPSEASYKFNRSEPIQSLVGMASTDNGTALWCIHGEHGTRGPDGACKLCNQAGSS